MALVRLHLKVTDTHNSQQICLARASSDVSVEWESISHFDRQLGPERCEPCPVWEFYYCWWSWSDNWRAHVECEWMLQKHCHLVRNQALFQGPLVIFAKRSTGRCLKRRYGSMRCRSNWPQYLDWRATAKEIWFSLKIIDRYYWYIPQMRYKVGICAYVSQRCRPRVDANGRRSDRALRLYCQQ